jgi:uncharacterized protein (DUF1330 family)
MAAYLVARIDVTDWSRYRQYMALTPDIIKRFGGRFIARGGDLETLEGPEEMDRIVLVEFPSMERIRAFYSSPDYKNARRIREGAAVAQFVAVQGV